MNENELSFIDYIEMIRRHKWVVVAAFVAVVGLGALYTFRSVPLYRSTVTILIERETPKIVEASEVVTLGAVQAYDDYYNTQLKILESRDIRNKAYERIGREDIRLGALRIEPVRNSWMVKLSMDHPDPSAAALAVNTVAGVFVEENLERRMRMVSEARLWLSEQLGEAEERLQQAEQALEDYRQNTGEISLEQAQDITVARMRELNTSYTRAQDARVEAEARYTRMKNFNAEDGASAEDSFENAIIQSLKLELIARENEYRKLLERLTPSHHEMVRLSAQIEDIREKIADERASGVNALIQQYRREYETALQRERDLETLLEQQKENAMLLSRTAVDYNILRRAADTHRELYQMLLTQAQEIGLTGELRANNISILDMGVESDSPVSPNVPRNMAASALLGIMLGVGLVFAAEYLHDTVNTAEDVSSSVPGNSVKLLSRIPHIKDGDMVEKLVDDKEISFSCSACKQEITADIRHAEKKYVCSLCKKSIVVPAPSEASPDHKLHPHAHNAFGLLRTNLLYPPPESPVQNFLITSSVRNDGKTFVSLNLAIAFANIGKRVLIVGTDLRKPRMDSIFHVKAGKGLSQYLVGEAGIDEIIHDTFVENLSLVPCGRAPSSPELLLSSAKMDEFSRLMKERFDYIVYDSPPVAPVADAILLSASIADRTVLVARAEKTPRRIFRQAYQMIEEAREGIIAGVVLNDIFHSSSYHYYRYYKYYRDYESSGERV